MRGNLGLRAALCVLALGVALPYYQARGVSRVGASATHVSAMRSSVEADPVGFLSSLALGATAADVLPRAYVDAVAKARALPFQVAESAVPAFQGADGPGGAVTSLMAQTLLGQSGNTPDPQVQAQSRLSTVLGPVAQTLDSATAGNLVTNNSVGLARSLVDPASGVLHVTYQDLSIPARGQPLALQRTFVSGNGAPSALGNGWAFTYGTHLAYDANGNPMIEEAAGTITHFAFWEAPATYIALDAPTREILTLEPSGTASLLMIDGGSQQFDSLGRLTRLQDRAGIGLTVNYVGTKLSTVLDSAGRALHFTTNSTGLITAITDPTGTVVRYGHNAAGDLTSVTNAAGATTRYTYSTPVTNSYDMPRLTGIILPRGATIRFSYNVGAQVTRVAGPGAMSTSITYTGDADPGAVRTDLTDATGAHTEIDTFATTPISGAAQLPTVTHIVDPTGRSALTTRGPAGTSTVDGEGRLTQVGDDGDGRPTVIQSPGTGTTRLGYDDLTSELSSLTDSSGHAVTLLYDAKGNLTGIRDADGAVTQVRQTGSATFRVINAGGGSATIRFDPAGNVTEVVDAVGRRTQFTWDLDGRLTGINDRVHGRTTYAYGASGELLSRTVSEAVTRYAYDPDGDLTSVRDPLGHVWRFTYNVGDLPTALTDPLGETWRLSYDDDGRVTALADPLGKVTKIGYDGAGRLLSTSDPLGHTTRYRYGAAGELVSATSPAGHVTHYGYDAAGRPSVIRRATGSADTLTYDAAGQLIGNSPASGDKVTYQYDGEGRLTGRTATDGSGSTYAYNAAGYLAQASDKSGTIRDLYDAAGDLTATTDPSGHTIRYDYDGSGRLATMIAPSGAVTRYHYDAVGHIVAIDDPLGNSTFRYDALGERVAAALPGGIAVVYRYDAAGRLISMNYAHGLKTVASFTYTYDKAGNVSSEQGLGDTLRYKYDAASQLIAVQGLAKGDNARYAYDADDNLLSSPVGSGWTYNASGQLTKAGGKSLAYDVGGTQVSGLNGAHYQFDQSGNLVSAKVGDVAVTYTQDALGRTSARTVVGKTTSMVYDGSDPVAMHGPGSTATARNLYGPWIDEPLASSAKGHIYTYIRDQLGSVRMVLNSAGKTVATLKYDAYGRVTGHTGSAPTTLGFTGRPSDPTTGLVNLRNRLYDPALARFLSPDPLATPGAPTYLYVDNNPATLRDPLGLRTTPGGLLDSWGDQAGLITGAYSAVTGSNAAGVASAAIAIGQAARNPTGQNKANAAASTAGAAISYFCPECGPATFIAGVYVNAAGQFAAAGAALDNRSPDSDGGSVNNTDPTFIDGDGPTLLGPGSQAGRAALTLDPGTTADALFPINVAGSVTVTVYDVLGKSVRVLAERQAVAPLVLDIGWNGRDSAGKVVAPGVYYALADEQPTNQPARDVYTLRVITVTAKHTVGSAAAAAELPAGAGVSARIVTPATGSLVRGYIPINGAALGPDFSHYALDYGQGADPATWTDIVGSSSTAVPDLGPVPLAHLHTLAGNLGTLNTGLSDYFYYRTAPTQGLSGLYTIRLRVFGHRGETATAIARVIVGRVATYVQDATIDSPDGGASLAVPSFAIHDIAQVFAVQQTTASEPIPADLKSLAPVYALHPTGYVFTTPATLKIHVSSAARGAAIYAWNANLAGWQPLPTTTAAEKQGATLSTPISRINQTPALYTVLVPSAAPSAPLLFPPTAGTGGSGVVTLAVATRPGAAVQVLASGRPSGLPVSADGTGLAIIQDIRLQPGVNRFTAVTRDGAGHTSAASPAITVTYAPKAAVVTRSAGAAVPLPSIDLAPTAAGKSVAAPLPPVVNSPTLHAVLAADFRRPQDLWSANQTPLGSRTAVTTDGAHTALQITGGGQGELTTFLPISTFNLATHPLITFSYKVPIALAVDLAVHANGTWWAVPLSDNPPSANDAERLYFSPLAAGKSLNFVRDNRWHDVTINLYQLIRDARPTGPIVVDRMAFGDWAPSGWLGVRPATTNPPQASFLLDNVALPAVSRRSTASFTWSEPSNEGINAYNYVVDQKAGTEPPTRSMGLVTKTTVGPLATGSYWLHVRARNRAGVWGPAVNYPFVIDTLPLRVGKPNPGPGGTGDAFVTVPISDPGASGVDASTIRFQVFDKTYSPGGNVVSYDLANGRATLNLGYIQPPPPKLFPGGKVPIVLLAAGDAAGNGIGRPIAWTYTLDIPNALPGGAQLLTTRGGDSPTFSPDATQVAFISNRSGAGHLWTIDAGDLGEKKGTARQIVSGPGVDADPAWSPTGDTIAFDSTRDGSRHLYLVHPDGSGLTRITDGASGDMQPTWSPDGKQIAFVNNGNLLVVNRDGSGLRTVIADGEHAVRDPAWSPDGKLIAFRHSLYVDQIWTVHPDGTGAGILTSLGDGESQSSPTWLADGRVAYVSLRDKVSTLYTIYPDGSEQHTLIGQPPALLFTPAASLDGSTVAFVSTETGNHNIFVSRQFRIDPLMVNAPSFDVTVGGKAAIRYGLSSAAKVSVTVSDVNDTVVRTLAHNLAQTAGTYQLTWDGKDNSGHILGEGAYSIQVTGTAPGLPALQRGVGVAIDDVSQHGTLRVQVGYRGRPIGGVTLTVLRASTDSYVLGTETDKTGAATISLSPGKYDVLAQADNGNQGSADNVTIRRQATLNQVIDLVVPTSQAAGSSGTTTTPSPSPTTTGSATPFDTPAPIAGSKLFGNNLMVNGNAEAGPGAMTDAAHQPPPGWKTPALAGTGEVVVTSYAAGQDLSNTTPGPQNRGKNYFYGGAGEGKNTSAEQSINLSSAAKAIDAGGVRFTLSGWLGGYSDQSDDAVLRATFVNAAGQSVGVTTIGPVTAAMRHDNSELLPLNAAEAVPVGTRSVVIDLIIQFYNGGDNDGMADNLSLVLNTGTATGPTSTSTATPTLVAETPVKSIPTATATVTATSTGGNVHSGTLIVTAFTSPGHPAVDAEVQVYLGKKLVVANYTDSSGVISFTLPPGTYNIKVDLHDAETTIPVVKVAANTVTRETASLGAGTLHVLVEMAPGRPAPDAEVQVYRGNTSVAANYTDTAGTYVFTLDAGTYTLHTTLGDAVGPMESVRVDSGAATQQTVNLNAGTLQVVVDLSPGKPAPDTEVEIYRGTTSVGANYTDGEGITSFILNAGSYTLHPSLGAATGPVGTTQVRAGETDKVRAILNAGILTVKVLSKAGQPANSATVAIYAGKTYVTTKYTDDGGKVSFIVNAGAYNVLVSQGSTTNKPVPVKVAAGATGDYTVRLGT